MSQNDPGDRDLQSRLDRAFIGHHRMQMVRQALVDLDRLDHPLADSDPIAALCSVAIEQGRALTNVVVFDDPLAPHRNDPAPCRDDGIAPEGASTLDSWKALGVIVLGSVVTLLVVWAVKIALS